MKFTQDFGTATNVVRGYEAGRVRIGERWYSAPLIVLPELLVTDWSPPAPADLRLEDLVKALEGPLEVLILGTGARHVFPAPNLAVALAQRRVGLETMDTAAACRTYNILMSEDRQVAAALYLGAE